MLALKCNQTALRAISIYNLQLQLQQWVEVCSGAWTHCYACHPHIWYICEQIRIKLVANDRRMQMPF